MSTSTNPKSMGRDYFLPDKWTLNPLKPMVPHTDTGTVAGPDAVPNVSQRPRLGLSENRNRCFQVRRPGVPKRSHGNRSHAWPCKSEDLKRPRGATPGTQPPVLPHSAAGLNHGLPTKVDNPLPRTLVPASNREQKSQLAPIQWHPSKGNPIRGIL